MPVNPGIPFDIPGYRIVRPLGQGGMATVYLATQTALGRQVAIKVLDAARTPDEDLIKRFENETRTIARLDHPHIVSIYEVGRASTGQLYYTLPYLPNGDLSSRRNLQDQRHIIGILRALAQALAYAHEQGIVHRDVKPENVLFDKLDRPLLADFGIALARHSSARVTREGATLGSSGYMSPEQARGLAIDGRSDLYSLGVMTYEMLTGDLPFLGPDAIAVALAHVEQPVPRLPPTRRHWQGWIDKTLAKDPDQRFQSATELLRSLEEIEAGLEGRDQPAVSTNWRERLANVPTSAWVGAGALAGSVALLALLLWPHSTDPAESRFVTAAPIGALSVPAADTPAALASAPTKPAAEADITRLMVNAGDQVKLAKLVNPAGDNAAESYLAVLALDPAHTGARAGLHELLGALGKELDAALQRDDKDAMRTIQEQARMLAERAGLRDSPVWQDYLGSRRKAFEERLQQTARSLDRERIAALKEPAEILSQDQPDLLDIWRAAETALTATSAQDKVPNDAGGPQLVFVPARVDGHSLDHAFALARTEVTRGEYAAFAKATGRADARCREPKRPWSRLKQLDWRDPDFGQSADEPVVCVSWLDAFAYARWLSAKTGASYRLPTESEWQHAARSLERGDVCEQGNVADASMGSRFTLATRHKCSDGRAHTAPVSRYRASSLGLHDLVGNVSEWTLDCGASAPLERLLQPDACPERIFRGTSWRDGPDDNTSTRRGTSAPDTGYTTIGFRLLRELNIETPPTTAAR